MYYVCIDTDLDTKHKPYYGTRRESLFIISSDATARTLSMRACIGGMVHSSPAMAFLRRNVYACVYIHKYIHATDSKKELVIHIYARYIKVLYKSPMDIVYKSIN